MKEFIFICGKNPDISLAEIVCYFEAREIDFEIRDYSNAFALIGCNGLPSGIMNDLGGTLKIAEVIFSAKPENPIKEVEQSLDFSNLFRNITGKSVFGVSSYNSRKEQILFSELFKSKMKENGLKAGYMHLPEGRSVLANAEVIKKKLIENSFEVILCSGKRFYVGKTLFVHNPFDFRKRDIKRPAQRTIYSIPPRLCKIMINLSCAKNGILLDPFCGIGTILQEAALMGYDIRGVDIDKNAVNACLKNLDWLQKEYEIEHLNKKIIVGNAENLLRFFGRNSIDAIVTEPYLGPPLKQKPDYRQARKILDKIKTLYEEAIKNMVEIIKPGKRIVLVSPCFRTEHGLVRLDIEKLCKGCVLIDPLKKYDIRHKFPFLDYEERHRTIREINIIEKLGI